MIQRFVYAWFLRENLYNEWTRIYERIYQRMHDKNVAFKACWLACRMELECVLGYQRIIYLRGEILYCFQGEIVIDTLFPWNNIDFRRKYKEIFYRRKKIGNENEINKNIVLWCLTCDLREDSILIFIRKTKDFSWRREKLVCNNKRKRIILF